MASDNIREWGRANGFDVSDDGRLPSGLRAAFDTRDEETPVDGAPEDTDNAERPPAIVKPTAVDRVRSLAERAKKNTPAKPVSRAARLKARVSVEKVISSGWALAASVVSNLNPAVAGVLAMQAPVAGMILEDKVKGTLVDRVLQPVARAADGGNVAMALVGPPLLVQALSMQPHRAPQIIPLLRQALRSWVVVAGDKLQAVQEENQRFEDTHGKNVDAMIGELLYPIYGRNIFAEAEGE